MSERTRWQYIGPVLQFGRVIDHIDCQTLAVTKQKAISNIVYNYKRLNGFDANRSLSLDIKYLKEVT